MSEDDRQIESASGQLYDAEKRIEEAIQAYDKESGGDGALITGWAVVVEWIDENGDPSLTAFARENMPYWRIDALLEAAPDAMIYMDDDFE